MPELIISHLDPTMLAQLNQRASQHGRTLEDEVKSILEQAATTPSPTIWSAVDAIREQLAATGRDFSDSAQLVREDRQR